MDDNNNKSEEAFPSSKALEYLFKRLLVLETRIEQLEEKNAAPQTDNALSAKADSIEKKLDMLIGLLQNAPKSADVEDIGGQAAVQNSEQSKPKAKSAAKEKQVAVFIDGENISHKKAKKIIEHANTLGKIEFSRVYGVQNNPSDKCWVKASDALNIKHIRLSGGSKKNKVDKKMFEEILGEAKKKEHADIFVVATNDGDFAPTVKAVKDMEISIVVVGLKKAMSDKMKKACNSVVYI